MEIEEPDLARRRSGGRGFALRMAWRDVRRHGGRSGLIAALKALPVLVMVALLCIVASAVPTRAETADRVLGGFDAELVPRSSLPGEVQHPLDVAQGVGDISERADQSIEPASLQGLLAAAGSASATQTVSSGLASVSAGGVVFEVPLRAGDFADPGFVKRFDLRSGKHPSGTEVLLSPALMNRIGIGIGGTVMVEGAGYPVSGSLLDRGAGGLEAPGLGSLLGIATEGSLEIFVAPEHQLAKKPDSTTASVFVKGMPITVSELGGFNDRGIGVVSREVILDPELGMFGFASMEEQLRGQASSRYLLVLSIGFFAFLEVGLLAGAAFAVGAKTRARTLALLAANGAEARELRAITTATGLCLGTLGVVAGTGLGLLAAYLAMPMSRALGLGLPGFHIPWQPVLAIAGTGLLAAYLAALFPAWRSSRQSPSLALRSASMPTRAKARITGPLLLCLGIVMLAAGTVWGLGADGQQLLDERTPTVLRFLFGGMLACTLGLLLSLGRIVRRISLLAPRLPLASRLAVRDAHRNAGRTLPAMAAAIAGVALTSAMAVGLGWIQQQESTLPRALDRNMAMVDLGDAGAPGGKSNDPRVSRGAERAGGTLTAAGLAPRDTAVIRNLGVRIPADPNGNTMTDEFELLLAPGSSCRFGLPDLLASVEPTATTIRELEAGMDAVRSGADRGITDYCGLDPERTGTVPSGMGRPVVVDEHGLELILGEAANPEVRAAFARGTTLVGVPELVENGVLRLGVPDYGYVHFSGSGRLGGLSSQVHASIVGLKAMELVLPDNGLPRILVPASAAVAPRLGVTGSHLVVDLGRPPAADESRNAALALERIGAQYSDAVVLESREPANPAPPWTLMLSASVLILTTTAITLSLSLSDGRKEQLTLHGIGASTAIRRRLGAVQAALGAGIGVLAGLVLGVVPLLLGIAVLGGAAPLVPLVPLSALLLLPLPAAGIGWLLVPRKPPSRRPA